MRFHVVTLFPGTFDSYLNESIISRAIKDKKVEVSFYNPRDFALDKWKRVDQKPYSGGPGMVIQAEPVIKAIEKALKKITKGDKKNKPKIILFSPSGKQFTTEYAKKMAKKSKNQITDIILVCGRYEGIDSRVKKVFQKIYIVEEVSVGPYILTGGELPAMVFIDCVSRQIEGVLGNFDSLEENRVSTSEVYTRPEVFKYKGKNYKVPKILLSGNHAEIEKWKKKRG